MKTYIRNTYQELEALGFEYDPDESNFGKRAYRHPYEPDTVLKLWDRASQSACIAILRKANHIAGLGSSGPKLPSTLKERVTLERAEARARRNRERLAYEDRVANLASLESGEERRLQLHRVSQLMGAGRPRTF